ncbi:MAG: hypothetical protein ACJ78Q_11715, partial [Chloroflexia bacterium]
AGALLGTGLLALNPIFFHLSYSFMTDVPFMCLLLIACYCYIRGLRQTMADGRWTMGVTEPTGQAPSAIVHRPSSIAWLLLGGAFAGYAFLVRQFGLLVPMGFLLYLVLDGVVTGRWRWRQMVAVGIVPALVIGGWYLWTRDLPPSGAAEYARRRAEQFMWNSTWLPLILERAASVVPLIALFAWTAVRVRRLHWIFVCLWSGVMGWAFFNLSVPHQSYSFIVNGNILRIDGIDFFEYNQETIWTPQIWMGLALFGAFLSALVLAQMTGGLLDWVASTWRTWLTRRTAGKSDARGERTMDDGRWTMGVREQVFLPSASMVYPSRPGGEPVAQDQSPAVGQHPVTTLPVRRVGREPDNGLSTVADGVSEQESLSPSSIVHRPSSAPGPESLSPLTGFYLVGAGILVVSLALLGDFFDRYALGFLPFVILFLVRASPKWGRLAWGYAIAALILVGTFTLVAKADFIDHNNARWEAGTWFQARVPLPVQVGFDWNNWYGFSNLLYQVTDLHIEGYRTERRFPYFSRLAGFTTRYVLAESRADTQPVRTLGP